MKVAVWQLCRFRNCENRFSEVDPKAAEQLGMTQPAASQKIRTLEAHVKKPLFVRHAREIVPTAIAHGQLALIHALDQSLTNNLYLV